MSSALTPRPRSARVRLGIGAGLVLLLIAGGVAAAAAALTPGGATTVLAPASASASPSTGSSTGSGSRAGASGSGRADDDGAAASSSDGGSSRIYIHVTGQVAHPGLFRLAPGSRVVDAVGAAGGLTAQADAAAINLARALDDGEQLHVPAVGEAPAAGTAGSGAGGGSSSGGGGGASGAGTGGAGGVKVNINTADQTALETLPRVGPALAQRILAWRQQNGRFASIEDLRDVSGIGEKTFEQLQPLVTV